MNRTLTLWFPVGCFDKESAQDPQRKRVTQPGAKRGVYKKARPSARLRIIEEAHSGRDWNDVATKNGVPIPTARTWVVNDSMEPKPRGGTTVRKISPDHIELLLSWLGENPTMTLKQLAEKLLFETGVQMCIAIISNKLDGCLFSVKRLHGQPVNMNAFENKTRRASYVQQLTEFQRRGKVIAFTDESNVNLFLR